MNYIPESEKDPEELLDIKKVADIIDVKVKTIHNWLAGANPKFPRGFKLGSGARAPRRWRRKVITSFLHDRESEAA